jgi:hypothetical protein
LGLHFAAQHPDLGAQEPTLAALHVDFVALQPGFAAQQPALAALTFLAFLGLAEQAPQLCCAVGAQVAEAAVGAIAMASPPATASNAVRLIDFVIVTLLNIWLN